MWGVMVGLTATTFIPDGVDSQSITEFPRVNSVSSVTIVEEVLYFNLEPVVPQQPFRDWWKEMETCTRIQKSFDDVRWFVANVILDVVEGPMLMIWGIYYNTPPEIIVVRNQTLAALEDTVKHETLHHLLWGTDHEEEVFAHCLPDSPKH